MTFNVEFDERAFKEWNKLENQLDPARTVELRDRMQAVGLPI